METLAQLHDCLLLDLDGTVFNGTEPVEGAVAALTQAGTRVLFVTNNASREALEVAEHLRAMGFDAQPEDIVTSAQSAAKLLAARLPADSAVLIVGTDALGAEVAGVGLRPVRRWADAPVAVVQGHSPRTGWRDLAEAALAIRGGALWVATNVDRTLPSERGLLPGNGAMVEALCVATDEIPQVAGKPEPTLLREALSRGDFHTPLVIGDRLETDIAGANAANLPSLLVLSGVSTASDAVRAPVGQRPTHIGHDLRCIHRRADELKVGPQPGWHIEVGGTTVTITSVGNHPPDDDLSVVRAAASAVWGHPTTPDGSDGCQDAQLAAGNAISAKAGPAAGPSIVAGDDAARAALERWSLVQPRDRLA